jgi:3-carboxy-cis,cis-muconate cycloisomerase
VLPPDRLFAGLFARGAVAAETSDRAVLRAMVEIELALLRALVDTGLAPAQAADGLPAGDALADALDLGELGRSTAEKGTPVPGLIRALRERLGEHPAAAYLHRGATSQDVVDTAIMLVARRALQPLLEDLAAAGDRCAELAERHRATVQPGRTLLQQAAPVTFGLKAAVWLTGLDEARAELERIAEQELAVQFGGAVGTLAALGTSGLEVMAALAQELRLNAPALPWQAVRIRPARLACGLAIALGVMAKTARDVVLLAQTEVGEATEGGGAGRGGSSTMPHKRNPVGAVAILACAQRAPGLSATILSAMAPEHERGAGSWQSECEPLLELLRLAGSAAAALRELLGGLELHPQQMRANMELTDGLVMSESVVAVLAESMPRPRAQELVEQAAQRAAAARRSLRDTLLELAEVAQAVQPRRLDQALAPESYLGVSSELIDRALAAHRG